MRLLACLAFLLAALLPACAEDGLGMKSILLVASRDLADPFFRESVVLVTHPGGQAPMGVIINRPTEVALARVFPEVERLIGGEDRLHFGGPVKRDELVVVFGSATKPPGALEILDGVYLGAERALTLELLSREDAAANVRVFSGHAGWAPGQLEAEIRRGDWHLARADAATLFAANPRKLWRDLERRARAEVVLAPVP